MNPLFLELSQNLDKLAVRSDILAAIDELEDQFDALSDIEQEIAERLIAQLNQRLACLTDE